MAIPYPIPIGNARGFRFLCECIRIQSYKSNGIHSKVTQVLMVLGIEQTPFVFLCVLTPTAIFFLFL